MSRKINLVMKKRIFVLFLAILFLQLCGTNAFCGSSKTIRIRGMVDGRDYVYIRGNCVWYEHFDKAAPGRHEGLNEPTYINGAPWYPTWPEPPPAEIRYHCNSSVYSGLIPSLPNYPTTVNLRAIQSRYSTQLIQRPSKENGYTLIFEWNDNPPGGHEWYEAEIEYTVVTIKKMGTPDDPNASIAIDPINVTNGNLYSIHQDISISTSGLPLEFTRTYNSIDEYNGVSGYGWTHSYNIFLNDKESYIETKNGEGAGCTYVKNEDGTYSSPAGEYSILIKNPDDTYTLTKKHGTKYSFTSNGKLTSIVNRNGNTQTLTYSGDLLTHVADSSGKSLSISYNADNRVSEVSDPAGRAVAYDYDAEGNLTSVTDPDNNITTYVYGEYHNLITITDPEGNGSHFTHDSENDRCESFSYDNDINKVILNYDPENKKTTVTDSKGKSSIYEYNYNGVVTKITDSESNERSWTWDENINRTSSTDANGNTTYFEYDDRGNLTKIKDPKAHETIFTYETDFDMCASITDALTQATTYTYDERGNLIQVENAGGDATVYTYDSSGNLLSTKDANNHTTQYEYNSYGNLIKVIDPLNNETQFEYSILGNCTKLIDAKENETQYTYDILSRLTQITYPDDSTVKYEYDKISNRTSVTDPLNRITNYTYDPANKLLEVIDALQNKTIYAYDTEGNRTSVEDASNNVTAYEYNSLNRLVKVITTSDKETAYTYDSAGNRVSMTDANGITTTYEYDENNRLVKITYADGKEVTFAYDELGRRTSMTDTTGTTTYEYDNLNRLVSVGTGLAPVRYTYDKVGNRISMTDQNGGVTTYQYDELNRLVSLTSPDEKVTNYTYDSVSNLTNMTLPNNTQVNYQFDSLNRLLNLTNKKNSGDEISSFEYEYNLAGMRNKVTLADGSYVNYSYDDVNRLTEEAKYSSSGNIGYSNAYEFDNVGNRTGKTNNVYGETTYTYNSENQLVHEYRMSVASQPKMVVISGTVEDESSTTVTVNGVAATISANTWSAQIELQPGENTVTVIAEDAAGNKASKSIALILADRESIDYSYDDNGNLVFKTNSSGTTEYGWDDENRLTGVTYPDSSSDSYTYDGVGKRIQTSEDGNVTNYLYDGLNCIIETDGTGATKSSYVRGLGYGGGIGSIISSNEKYYYYDGIGNVVNAADNAGNVTQSFIYDAYGNVLNGATPLPHGFSTKEYSSRSGLIHFGARLYDPTVGRFISKDPLGMIDGPNMYSYVNNNPINLIDPYGLCAQGTGPQQATPLAELVKPRAPNPTKFTKLIPVVGTVGIVGASAKLIPAIAVGVTVGRIVQSGMTFVNNLYITNIHKQIIQDYFVTAAKVQSRYGSIVAAPENVREALTDSRVNAMRSAQQILGITGKIQYSLIIKAAHGAGRGQ